MYTNIPAHVFKKAVKIADRTPRRGIATISHPIKCIAIDSSENKIVDMIFKLYSNTTVRTESAQELLGFAKISFFTEYDTKYLVIAA